MATSSSLSVAERKFEFFSVKLPLESSNEEKKEEKKKTKWQRHVSIGTLLIGVTDQKDEMQTKADIDEASKTVLCTSVAYVQYDKFIIASRLNL